MRNVRRSRRVTVPAGCEAWVWTRRAALDLSGGDRGQGFGIARIGLRPQAAAWVELSSTMAVSD